MKELLEYIVEGILGSNDFEIEESNQEGRFEFVLRVPKENMGLVIGKGGSTIKSIRNLLRVKSALDQTPFYLNVSEKQ